MSAYPVALGLAAGESFGYAVVFTANLAFQVLVLDLSAAQLLLVGSVLELTCFVAQVPTGVIADAVSRRLSIVLGYALVGAGFLVEGSAQGFAGVLAAQVVWGLGAVCVDGAREAWVLGELGEERSTHVFVRSAQAGQLAGLVGITVSALLAAASVRLAVLAGGAFFLLLALALGLVMPERGFAPPPNGRRRVELLATGRAGLCAVRATPALRRAMLAVALLGAASEGFDRLWTPLLLDEVGVGRSSGIGPVGWIAALNAVAMVLGVLVLGRVHRRLAGRDPRSLGPVLAGLYAAHAAAVAALALAVHLGPAVAAFLAAVVARGAAGPLVTAWVASAAPPATRATVLSLIGQADALGQVAAGPLLAGLTGRSPRRGLLAAAVLVAPAVVTLARGPGRVSRAGMLRR